MFSLSPIFVIIIGLDVLTCKSISTDYDYIVVGSATGGVVASRLAEDKNRVLLIEAGPDDLTYSCSSCNALPFGDLIAGTPLLPQKQWWFIQRVDEFEWKDATSMPSFWHYNEQIRSQKTEKLLRAKMLGGCLSHNSHRWIRGSVRDYDYIAHKLKLTDWSFDNVLPFYQKVETYLGENGTLRGNTGPIQIRPTSLHEWDIKYKALFDAAIKYGIPYNDHINGGYSQFGVGFAENNIGRYNKNKTGLFNTSFYRESSSQCYIRDIGLKTGHLTVWVNTVVQRIIFNDDKKAIGVEYYNDIGDIEKVYCKKEVIISGGAYKSPQLLMLSGIGPKDELNAFNITPIHINDRIGKYGQDHVYTLIKYGINQTYLSKNVNLPQTQYIEYENEKDYFFIPTGIDMFVSSNTYNRLGYDYNDIRFECGGWQQTKASDVLSKHILCNVDTAVYSKNVTIKLQNDLDARKYPKVYNNFFMDSRDYDVKIKGIRKLREIFAMNTSVFVEEINPGFNIKDDVELKQFIFANSKASLHAVGTLSMGMNDKYPVDSKCSLRGVNGLRIADASIWPYSTNGGNMALVFMIGEKCAHHIINDNKQRLNDYISSQQKIKYNLNTNASAFNYNQSHFYMILPIAINVVIISIIAWIGYKRKRNRNHSHRKE